MKQLTEPISLFTMIITLFCMVIGGLWSVFQAIESIATKEEMALIKTQLEIIQDDVAKTRDIAEFNKLEMWINLADEFILELEAKPVNDWTLEEKRKYKEAVENVSKWAKERELLVNG